MAEQVVDVGVAQADLSVAAARGLVHRRGSRPLPRNAERRADRVAAYRAGALAYQLHAVVVHQLDYGWRSPQYRRPRRGGRWQ